MNLNNKEVLKTGQYKAVYRDGDKVIKIFNKEHGKANVFNEALCTARVEETGLNVAKVLEVTQIDGDWALVLEYIEGKTLDELMKENPDKMEEYMEQFVELEQHYKFNRKISALRNVVDATIRFELHTRLDAMPKHHKLCHGDFNPSNVVVANDGTMYIIDWAHATIGNGSGDAAITYLEFAREDQKKADLYLKTFCKKADVAKQYVQKWMPIAAAVQLNKGNEDEKDFLMRCVDVMDFQ